GRGAVRGPQRESPGLARLDLQRRHAGRPARDGLEGERLHADLLLAAVDPQHGRLVRDERLHHDARGERAAREGSSAERVLGGHGERRRRGRRSRHWSRGRRGRGRRVLRGGGGGGHTERDERREPDAPHAATDRREENAWAAPDTTPTL